MADKEEFEAFINHPATAAFVGPKFEAYYKDVWSRQFAKKGHSLQGMKVFYSFNAGSLFVPVLWSFYRKFITPVLIIGGVQLIVFTFSLISGFEAPGIFYLALWLLVGTAGNAMYFQHVWEWFQKNKTLGEEEFKKLAFEKGGTSVGWMLGGIVIYGLIMGLAYALALQLGLALRS